MESSKYNKTCNGIGDGAGFTCQYIISKYPENAPISERVIPIAIFKKFEHDPTVCKKYLKQWIKLSNIENVIVDQS